VPLFLVKKCSGLQNAPNELEFKICLANIIQNYDEPFIVMGTQISIKIKLTTCKIELVKNLCDTLKIEMSKFDFSKISENFPMPKNRLRTRKLKNIEDEVLSDVSSHSAWSNLIKNHKGNELYQCFSLILIILYYQPLLDFD
jgi:hypothetical protein